MDPAEVDAALRYVLETNGVVYVHERGGRYFFEKQNPRTKRYDKYLIPGELLETLRTRFSRGEPPQDFEELVYPSKRKSQPSHVPIDSEETNVEFNRGDYVKLTEGAAQEVGVVWEAHPTDIASIQVHWWDGRNRWSKYYEPKNLTLVPPTEIPDYAVELRGSLGL